MAKVCKIYYGTVIDDEDGKWGTVGSHMQEPIQVEFREPLGKPPEYCCKSFEDEYIRGVMFYMARARIEMRTAQVALAISFCPFCGAKLVLIEDLKLRIVKTTRTVPSYYVEKAG